MQALRENAELDPSGAVARMLNVISAKSGNAKTVQNYRQLKDYVRSVYGKGVIKSWMQEHYPAEYARRFTGRVWKVQELIDLANPTVEGNIESRHASTYKKFIQARAPVAAKAVEAVAKAVARFPMVAESMRLRLVSSACSSTWVRLMVSIRAKSCSI